MSAGPYKAPNRKRCDMMYCRNCGQQISDEARFCRICGYQVKQTQSAPGSPMPVVEQPVPEAAPEYIPREPEIYDDWNQWEEPVHRKTTEKKKLVILLAAAAVLVIVLIVATILLIVSVTREAPEESSIQGSILSEESTIEPSEAPAVTVTPQPEETPAPATLSQRLTLEQAQAIVVAQYGGYAVLNTQTEQEYTFQCFASFDEASGAYSQPTSMVVVNAYSGEAQITQTVTDSILAPQTSQAPKEQPEDVPLSELSKLDGSYLSDMVSGYAPSATWSWAVMDIAAGDITGSSSMEESLSASALVNIPILYTVAARVDAGLMSLSDPVYISRPTAGRTQLSDNVGSSMSVQELLTYMLQYSDNIASNSLMEHLGFGLINSTCAEAGYGSVNLNNYLLSTEDYTANENYVSCADLCRMLSAIYDNQFSCLGKRFLQEYMVIQDSYAYQGLGAYVPGGTTFMNLNGQKSNKYNEVAIVDDGDCAYVVAFMSGMDDGTKLQYAAQDCGYYIYNTLDVG